MSEIRQYPVATVVRENGKFKIYLHSLIHVIIDETEAPIIAVQSYYWPDKKRYHIDYQFKNGKYHETWYSDRQTWEEILKEISINFR